MGFAAKPVLWGRTPSQWSTRRQPLCGPRSAGQNAPSLKQEGRWVSSSTGRHPIHKRGIIIHSFGPVEWGDTSAGGGVAVRGQPCAQRPEAIAKKTADLRQAGGQQREVAAGGRSVSILSQM